MEAACQERTTVNPKYVRSFVDRLRSRYDANINDPCSPYHKNTPIFEDLVHDASRIKAQNPPVPFSCMLNSILPPRKRDLYPQKRQSSLEKKGTTLNRPSRIVITVLGAKNVPRRSDNMVSKHESAPFLVPPPSIRRMRADMSSMSLNKSSRFQGNGDQSESAADGSNLNCLVQVKFGKQVISTRTDMQEIPSWKQVIELPLLSNDDEFTPKKLKEITEPIIVTLFDTVSVDIGKGGGYYDDENTEVTERRFLGSVKIPLKPISCQDQNEGSFPLVTPDAFLGYSHTYMKSKTQFKSDELPARTSLRGRNFLSSNSNDVESQFQPKSNEILPSASTLQLIINIEPKIRIADDEYHESLPSIESADISQYACAWVNTAKKKNSSTKRRHYQVLVPDIEGTLSLITCFLKGQKPPPDCETSMNQCAHYVSLVPFLSTWKAFANDHVRFWPTNKMTLELVAGDWEAHASLLANFFVNILRTEGDETTEVYLTFGQSISEGKVVSALY